MADQSVADNKRMLKQHASLACDSKYQMKEQRQQAKAARTQEKAAKEQLRTQNQAKKDAHQGR